MNRRIIVVGGGISGLAAAHRLIEVNQERALGLEVVLLEASQRLGGCIATERVGDFLVEAGPDSFIIEKPWALRLCERLGLTSRLISTRATQQNVYVVRKGSLEPLPQGFYLLAPTRLWPLIQTPLFSWRGKLRMALELVLPHGKSDGDESLASFVRRRFGAEVLERVAQPLIGGIYAADPERLSLRATMPRLLEMEQTRRSVIWAMWLEQKRRSQNSKVGSGARWSLFLTLAGGMQELVEALARKLPQDALCLRTKTIGLERNAATKKWRVASEDGEKLEADGVILAIPAYAAGALVASLTPELARELQAIPYASAATISLAFRQADVPDRLNGFGFVVPAIESRTIIACTFSSVKYGGRAPEGYVLLRAFVGGALQPALFNQDDPMMEKSVREELTSLLGIRAAPLFTRIYRRPCSMAQYHVGHQERVRRIERHVSNFGGLALAGNAYHGVGIADCIRSGEEAAERLLEQLG